MALFGVAHPAPECEDRASHYLDAEAAYPLLDAAAASAARPPVASAPPPSGAARPRARVLLFLGVTVHLVQLALHLFHLLLQLRLPMPSTPASPWALRTPSELSGGRAVRLPSDALYLRPHLQPPCPRFQPLRPRQPRCAHLRCCVAHLRCCLVHLIPSARHLFRSAPRAQLMPATRDCGDQRADTIQRTEVK